MCLDHSAALARITFEGLMVFCFNEQNQCELGLLKHGEHHPEIHVYETREDGSRHELVNLPVDLQRNLSIRAVNPVEPGVRPYPHPFDRHEFDGPQGVGHPEDFRWIVDLQSWAFHAENVSIDPRTGPDLLTPRLLITDGTFYTYRKTRGLYSRCERNNQLPDLFLGKIAHVMGVDIVCDVTEGSGVILQNDGGEPLELPRGGRPWLTYEISISNLRHHGGHPHASDFPIYYTVARDHRGIQFDLRNVMHERDPRANKERPVPDLADFFYDGEPQVCNQVFLSLDRNLP
jgi:hypothetical protein